MLKVWKHLVNYFFLLYELLFCRAFLVKSLYNNYYPNSSTYFQWANIYWFWWIMQFCSEIGFFGSSPTPRKKLPYSISVVHTFWHLEMMLDGGLRAIIVKFSTLNARLDWAWKYCNMKMQPSNIILMSSYSVLSEQAILMILIFTITAQGYLINYYHVRLSGSQH